MKIKSSQNGKITLSFTDICKSCLSLEFLTSQICLLTPFAKINSRENFGIYSIQLLSSDHMYFFFVVFREINNNNLSTINPKSLWKLENLLHL